MRNTVLSYFLLPLFAGMAFSAHASPSAPVQPMVVHATSLSSEVQDSSLNLNEADALTLQARLNGIGKAKAEAIVAYREANGPFTSVDELLEVRGIGNSLLDRNRDKITVE